MLQPGILLQNRYHIRRQIGGGGMGAVYLTEDNRLPGRRCAIKEMSPNQVPPQDRSWAIGAFEQEARMLANLKHPGLTPVTDFFTEYGNWYLVMDYIEGETLEAYLDRAPDGRLPIHEALRITHQLCEVLTYLHTQNPPVIFRDLKPGNVMLTPQSDVKLIDFGIARFFKSGKSRDTVNLGTPGYAAPEQYGKMGLQSGPRADVYSLGALLLQMITGYDPTTAPTPFPLPDPRSVIHTISPHIATVISRATHIQSNLRYGSAQEMQQGLFSPKPKKWIGLAGGGIAVLLIFSLLYWATNAFPKPMQESTPYPTTATVALVERPTKMPTLAPTATFMPTVTPMPTATFAPTFTPTPALAFFEGPIQYGTSYGKRPLYAYRLGTGPSVRAIIGGIHGGYEWNTVELVSDTLKLLQQNPSMIPANVTLYVIPCANPDGYASGTDAVVARMNGNLVDLNRNWDYDWQPVVTHGTRPVKAGDYPFSEPETAALRDLILGQNAPGRKMEAVIFYHSAMGVIFSGADRENSATYELVEWLSAATGYPHKTDGIYGEISTGIAIDWLSTQGIAGAEIELTAHDRIGEQEWQQNLRGIEAFLAWALPERVQLQPTLDTEAWQEEYITYTVQAGDLLAGIAYMYEVDFDLLMEINDVTDPDLMWEGQVLKIPIFYSFR